MTGRISPLVVWFEGGQLSVACSAARPERDRSKAERRRTTQHHPQPNKKELNPDAILESQKCRQPFRRLQALEQREPQLAEKIHGHAIYGRTAGKSTLLNCDDGQANPRYGSVMFDGHRAVNASPTRSTNGISRVFQTARDPSRFMCRKNIADPCFANAYAHSS